MSAIRDPFTVPPSNIAVRAIDARMTLEASWPTTTFSRVQRILVASHISTEEYDRIICAGLEPHTDATLFHGTKTRMHSVPSALDVHFPLSSNFIDIERCGEAWVRSMYTDLETPRSHAFRINSAVIFCDNKNTFAWRVSQIVFWYLEAMENLSKQPI